MHKMKTKTARRYLRRNAWARARYILSMASKFDKPSNRKRYNAARKIISDLCELC